MSTAALVVLIHQIVFQGMFLAKNVVLRRKLGKPIRGWNPEATLSIALFVLFIIVSFLFALCEVTFGTVRLVASFTAMTVALVLLCVNILIGAASLIGLRDSWRVGVLEDQKTELIVEGIYRFSRNPYFLSYLIMFFAYTILLLNIILLILTLVGFGMIHAMVIREEKHLVALHGDRYRRYKERVPRYIIF